MNKGDSMAIVKEYMSGNCKIIIDNAFIVESKDYVNQILKEISIIYSQYFSENPERYID